MMKDIKLMKVIDEETLERIDDALENALIAHEPLDNDSRCRCGARNNMDGDVLHGHRLGALSQAVRGALGVAEADQ